MGLVHAQLRIVNTGDLEMVRRGYMKKEEVKEIEVKALVDTGAYMLAINEHVKNQLDLPVIERQEVELADGTLKEMDIAGPVEVYFKNRSTTVRAAVLPGNTEILLGAIPMEDMDVIVHPKKQELIVNPEAPYMAKKSLK